MSNLNNNKPLPLTLVPSLPAHNFLELEHLAHALDGIAPGFQIDIVDGQFVPHTAWPFTEADVRAEWVKIKTLPQSFAFELDCMVEQPEQYLADWADLPLTKLLIHVGSTDRYGEIINFAKARGWQVGLAFTNDVPLSFIYPYVPKIDGVQIMGIAHVGRQGQPFDERTIVSAQTLREQFPQLSIAVDGSVNAVTIPLLKAAGVNHFAPGSAISRTTNPVAAYKQLTALLTQ